MTSEPKKAPQPPVITDPEAAELSESGNWAETQVIESIKEANFRGKDPDRALRGQATQALHGDIFHPVKGEHGKLVTPKRSLRARIKRLLGYFKG